MHCFGASPRRGDDDDNDDDEADDADTGDDDGADHAGNDADAIPTRRDSREGSSFYDSLRDCGRRVGDLQSAVVVVSSCRRLITRIATVAHARLWKAPHPWRGDWQSRPLEAQAPSQPCHRPN